MQSFAFLAAKIPKLSLNDVNRSNEPNERVILNHIFWCKSFSNRHHDHVCMIAFHKILFKVYTANKYAGCEYIVSVVITHNIINTILTIYLLHCFSIEDRKRIHHKWLRNELQCIVATVAFGMGIDKHDVR